MGLTEAPARGRSRRGPFGGGCGQSSAGAAEANETYGTERPMTPTLSTKERILASAMHLLDTGGPAAVTLRAVGDATGVSAAAPYRHYEDKRALLEAMVRANLEYFKAALEKAR